MKPLIGINLDIESGKAPQASVYCNYYESVQAAGGIPVLLPPMPAADLEDLLKQLAGIMLIGGRDYSPEGYGESACDKVVLINSTREAFDLELVKSAVNKTRLPVLGICGGCQLLNIGLGGTLVQDIPTSHPGSAVKHSSANGWLEGWTLHKVTMTPESRLAKIYAGKAVDVPTSHHQSVKKLGTGLVATAHAEDGVIEAVELAGDRFAVGVQWHPERDFDGNQNLFREFIKHASAHYGK